MNTKYDKRDEESIQSLRVEGVMHPEAFYKLLTEGYALIPGGMRRVSVLLKERAYAKDKSATEMDPPLAYAKVGLIIVDEVYADVYDLLWDQVEMDNFIEYQLENNLDSNIVMVHR